MFRGPRSRPEVLDLGLGFGRWFPNLGYLFGVPFLGV